MTRQQEEIHRRVREYFRAENFQTGARIPAERELATTLGVGRTVLRPVLEVLEREGVLERRPQAGTFLREIPLPYVKGAQVAFIAPFGEMEVGERQTEPLWLHRVTSTFERVARPAGLDLRLVDQSPHATDPCSIKELSKTAVKEGAQAVVLVHPLGSRCTIACALGLLDNLGVHPIIASARTYPGMASSVYFDSAWGIYRATRHLLDLGHRRIGFAAGSIGHEWVRERIAGYQQALDAAEIEMDPTWVWQQEEGERLPQPQDGEHALAYWMQLSANERPTAVIAANDIIALGLLNAARARGISIPGDLSVIGFDNDPGALLAGLSTLERPTVALGEALARLTLDRLAQTQQAATTHRLLPTFIERSTVARPSSSN